MPFPEKLSFVVFSDDWGIHPSSCQHLFRVISRDHDVVWVNTVGMRRPRLNLRDLRKAMAKLHRMWQRAERSVERGDSADLLEVIQPAQVPIPGFRPIEWVNARSAQRAVTKRLSIREMTNPIVVSTVPNAARSIALLPAALTVYYCVDDFGLWPGHDRKTLAEMEQEIVRGAGLLLAPTANLARRPIFEGRTVHMLPHGVDVDHFSKVSDVAASLACLPAPRAGFFGLMDDRVDQALIARLARAMPDWTFVFAGPATVSFRAWEAIPNIFPIGPVNYPELPKVIAGLDVLLLPYRVNELTRSLAPLKLREYIASGKPVVASDLPEAEAMGPWISTASSVPEWARAIEASRAVDYVARRQEARLAMASHSWAARAETFLALCRANLRTCAV